MVARPITLGKLQVNVKSIYSPAVHLSSYLQMPLATEYGNSILSLCLKRLLSVGGGRMKKIGKEIKIRVRKFHNKWDL